jgi:hypothetical protein
MNIPDKVKIGYKDFKINKVDGEVIEDDEICYGVIYNDKGFINISGKYSEDLQKCTVIHECIHGIDNVFDIGLKEEQVEKLAKGLYGFIKDNPEVFKN